MPQRIVEESERSAPLNVSEPHKCTTPECETLKTVHELKVELQSNPPCDSKLARSFDGTLFVGRLVTAFEIDGEHRGFHAGDFEWTGTAGLKVAGRMSGVTNVGTHREPPFKPCQKCDERGVMEGRLCGQVTTSQDPALKRCQVIAAYRIRFDPSRKGGNGGWKARSKGLLFVRLSLSKKRNLNTVSSRDYEFLFCMFYGFQWECHSFLLAAKLPTVCGSSGISRAE
jgi:hypothetical protein